MSSSASKSIEKVTSTGYIPRHRAEGRPVVNISQARGAGEGAHRGTPREYGGGAA